MKVALLGPPGSGKTKIANRLRKLLDGQWKVVDNYIDTLVRRTGQPFGVNVNYYGHLAAITARMVAEWEAENKGLNTITCGSIFESIIYAATMQFMPLDETYMLL